MAKINKYWGCVAVGAVAAAAAGAIAALVLKKDPLDDFDDFDDDFEVVYEDLEERIKSIIGSKVHVNHKANGKGKIEIEYYSDNDLERIFELLMSIQEGK